MQIQQTNARRGALAGSCLALCLVLAGPAEAGTELRSGPARVMLLELFTSQGCSSCPPADRWMSRLIDRPGLWVDYVPLAFHVDYWDDIGWVDRFATPEYSTRQRRYAQAGGIDIVYTPGFVLNGREWRRWRATREPTEPRALAGVLSASVGDEAAAVDYSPSTPSVDRLVANVTILGFGLKSAVLTGENHGRTLVNDFVVLGFAQQSMTRTGNRYRAEIPMPGSAVSAKRRAIVVWVAGFESQLPVQAAGRWMVDSP